MLRLVTVPFLLGVVLSVPVRFEEPKEDSDWWFNAEAMPWDSRGAQLENSPFYNTFRQMDQQLDMYGYAQHVGKINRGEYFNPELNLPGNRAHGYRGDFNRNDLTSGAFRYAPKGQRVVAEPVHVALGMASSVGDIITVGAGLFIKPDGTILVATQPGQHPCNPDPCARVFPSHRSTCVALDATTAKCERIINGGYTEWTAWGPCNAGCERERSRTCDNPATSNGGAPCVGSALEIEPCSGVDDLTDDCVDGNWGTWDQWAFDIQQCGADCGTITKTRTRMCDDPSASIGGLTCPGPSSESGVHDCQAGEGTCPTV